jgi:hypothetical protein
MASRRASKAAWMTAHINACFLVEENRLLGQQAAPETAMIVLDLFDEGD